MIRMSLLENFVGWEMAYHDLAFSIKVLHGTEGVKDEAPFFDFGSITKSTDELDSQPYQKQRVVDGECVKVYDDTAARDEVRTTSILNKKVIYYHI